MTHISDGMKIILVDTADWMEQTLNGGKSRVYIMMDIHSAATFNSQYDLN